MEEHHLVPLPVELSWAKDFTPFVFSVPGDYVSRPRTLTRARTHAHKASSANKVARINARVARDAIIADWNWFPNRTNMDLLSSNNNRPYHPIFQVVKVLKLQCTRRWLYWPSPAPSYGKQFIKYENIFWEKRRWKAFFYVLLCPSSWAFTNIVVQFTRNFLQNDPTIAFWNQQEVF